MAWTSALRAGTAPTLARSATFLRVRPSRGPAPTHAKPHAIRRCGGGCRAPGATRRRAARRPAPARRGGARDRSRGGRLPRAPVAPVRGEEPLAGAGAALLRALPERGSAGRAPLGLAALPARGAPSRPAARRVGAVARLGRARPGRALARLVGRDGRGGSPRPLARARRSRRRRALEGPRRGARGAAPGGLPGLRDAAPGPLAGRGRLPAADRNGGPDGGAAWRARDPAPRRGRADPAYAPDLLGDRGVQRPALDRDADDGRHPDGRPVPAPPGARLAARARGTAGGLPAERLARGRPDPEPAFRARGGPQPPGRRHPARRPRAALPARRSVGAAGRPPRGAARRGTGTGSRGQARAGRGGPRWRRQRLEPGVPRGRGLAARAPRPRLRRAPPIPPGRARPAPAAEPARGRDGRPLLRGARDGPPLSRQRGVPRQHHAALPPRRASARRLRRGWLAGRARAHGALAEDRGAGQRLDPGGGGRGAPGAGRTPGREPPLPVRYTKAVGLPLV